MSYTPLPKQEELQLEVNRFRRDCQVYICPENIPTGINVRADWLKLLREQDVTRKCVISKEWNEFRDVLPRLISFLDKNLVAIALLVEPNQIISLLYVYRRKGKVRLFQGWPPLVNSDVPAKLKSTWSKLPKKLRSFYENLHNGWVFLASSSMGPLPTHLLKFLSDEEWNLKPGEVAQLPFHLNAVIALMGNGAGDYLCIDTKEKDEAQASLVWWHEEPNAPDTKQDFWAVLDTWLSIFLEGAEK